MRNSSYVVRNYRASDFASLVRLENEAQRLAVDGGYLSPQAIRERLGRPNHSPELDLFIVEASGAIVGYLDITPEIRIGRVVLDCFIRPEHRRRGLATGLLGYASHRAKALGAKVAHVNVLEGNTVARIVLDKLGFQPVRRFHELRLELGEVSFTEMTTGFPIRHFQEGEEDQLTETQNRCFVGTWGYNPNTEEDIRYFTRIGNYEPGGILLAHDGDRPVGYCWTRIEYGGEPSAHGGKGRIFMLGVDPDYRNTGIGKRLLLAGLSYLKSKGLRVAQLTVDSENKAANTLCRHIGFKACDSSLWYEKALG